MTKSIKFLILFMLLFISTLSNLKAQSCDALLKDLMNYAKEGGTISYQIVGLGGDNYWGQYAKGELSYSASTVSGSKITIETLTGGGLQYFSDRSDECPPRTSGFGNPNDFRWFSKYKTDEINLKLSRGGLIVKNCPTPVTITLITWGNAKYTFCPTCKGEFMYLLDNGMVLRFSKLPRVK
jgi:hypothetical protein